MQVESGDQGEFLRALGERVASARGKLSQRELAEASDVDVSTISRIENGKFNPSIMTLNLIATALQCSLGSLVGRDGSPEKPHEEILQHLGRIEKHLGIPTPSKPLADAPAESRSSAWAARQHA